ncbi:MAG: dihydroorotase [Chloroflexi bacterium]|nr:dihydroorotase [Chloroflexota bacterium]
MILEEVRRIEADGTERTTSVRIGSDMSPNVDGRGLLVLPGLIDLHAHLREPGYEESETVATGARAALRGGFTTVCAMANTMPAIDSPGLVAELAARGRDARAARVLPVAAITRGREGKQLADLVELAAAGAVAFSDDGDPVDDARLFRSALEYAHAARRPVMEHVQDRALSGRGVMHEGAVSAALGLPGIPAAAEESAVARDIAIAKLTGARLHLQHVSTAGALELVRHAKADGISVTCEVTPHHLALTDEWVGGSRAFVWEPMRGASPPQTPQKVEDDPQTPRGVPYDSATKVNPPLRTAADVRALWRGLADGTVDAIATDHAPHASFRKDVEYAEAAFGISGIETALAVLLMAVDAGMGELGAVVRALTSGPARVLDMRGPDDLIVVDPALEWTVTAGALASKGKNTPLLGRRLRGKVIAAVVEGEVRYRDETAMQGRAGPPGRIKGAEAIARR